MAPPRPAIIVKVERPSAWSSADKSSVNPVWLARPLPGPWLPALLNTGDCDVEQVGPGRRLAGVGVEVEEDGADDGEEDAPRVRPVLLRVNRQTDLFGQGRVVLAQLRLRRVMNQKGIPADSTWRLHILPYYQFLPKAKPTGLWPTMLTIFLSHLAFGSQLM